YLEQRSLFMSTSGSRLAMPKLRPPNSLGNLDGAGDFLIIDCPGSSSPAVRMAHSLAHTVITPVNDSMIDIDLLVHLDPRSLQPGVPGIYAKWLLEVRKTRLAEKRGTTGLDWLVVRNRRPLKPDPNTRDVWTALENTSNVLGFRLVDGMCDRPIFRQLFLYGLTVFDLDRPEFDVPETRALATAREEVDCLLRALWLPHLSDRLEQEAANYKLN
ncbi:MAG: division plane positioning ATPase MipZ, partial [Rhodospirillales bacterium]|nr:division plane positioning ATPase MipZ [Rhodospirillales bacterium]